MIKSQMKTLVLQDFNYKERVWYHMKINQIGRSREHHCCPKHYSKCSGVIYLTFTIILDTTIIDSIENWGIEC